MPVSVKKALTENISLGGWGGSDFPPVAPAPDPIAIASHAPPQQAIAAAMAAM